MPELFSFYSLSFSISSFRSLSYFLHVGTAGGRDKLFTVHIFTDIPARLSDDVSTPVVWILLL